MENEGINPLIQDQIRKLQLKYEAMGQDLSSYLDGLLHANYLNYWDYIHLDTLMSLQSPKTDFPDEMVFIIYHQITELYFKLINWEIDQLIASPSPTPAFFAQKIGRVNRYWGHLVSSFDVMVDGMEKEQFLKFRMSLLPSSGFQSVQYRLIELKSTDGINLVAKDKRDLLAAQPADLESLYEHIYWKRGASELASGKKTLTLQKFERKYGELLRKTLAEAEKANLWSSYLSNIQEQDTNLEIKGLMRDFDYHANVLWPLSHLKSAIRYLQNDPDVISATGGTNWQKYLPPRQQSIVFFPQLWTEEELNSWGRKLMRNVNQEND